jgi:hypothetical protein
MSVPIFSQAQSQETFNRVVQHLRDQGEKSFNDKYKCAYRGTQGRSCAVGCLISDSQYRSGLEGQAASSTPVARILIESGHDVGLCYSLQTVHDLKDVTQWEEGFRKVATLFDLVYEKPLKQEIISDVHA